MNLPKISGFHVHLMHDWFQCDQTALEPPIIIKVLTSVQLPNGPIMLNMWFKKKSITYRSLNVLKLRRIYV